MPMDQLPQVLLVQGNNGNDGNHSQYVSQGQQAQHPQLPEPSFFGGESVFHAMVGEPMGNEYAGIYGQHHLLYGSWKATWNASWVARS